MGELSEDTTGRDVGTQDIGTEDVGTEDVGTEDVGTEDAGTEDAGTEDAVLLFVGGPLDGRVEIREARHGEPLPTITHVHLHGGPKVVHRYDLTTLTGTSGIYTVRPRQNVRDRSVAD